MTTEEAYERLAKLEMEDSDDAVALGLALGALIYYRNIANLPDCNVCQKKHTGCPYLPRYGEYTRINCPLYKKEGLPLSNPSS